MKKLLSLIVALCMVFACAAATAEGLSGEFSIVHFNNSSDASGTSRDFWQETEAFKAANPDVTINADFIAHDDYETYLNTLIAGDSLPDVFLIKGDLVTTLSEADMIYPMKEIIEADADWYAQYVDGAFDDGMGYTVPFQMQANCCVIYNQKIFDECGVAFPETIEELISLVPVFQEKGYTTIGLGNGGQWLAPSCVVNTFMYRFVDAEWFESLRSGAGAAWTDEAIVKGLTAFQDLVKAGAFNEDCNSIDQDGMYELYYQEKCAMMINGAWMLASVIADCPEEILANTHVALMPAVEGGLNGNKNTAAGAGWGWAVNKKTVDEAKLQTILPYLRAITTGDYATNALSMGFFSAANAGEYDASALAPLFQEYATIEANMNFLPIWDVVLPASFGSGEYYATTQELIMGSITPEEMAQSLQEAWEMAQQ